MDSAYPYLVALRWLENYPAGLPAEEVAEALIRTIRTGQCDNDYWVIQEAVAGLGYLGERAGAAIPELERLLKRCPEEGRLRGTVEHALLAIGR